MCTLQTFMTGEADSKVQMDSFHFAYSSFRSLSIANDSSTTDQRWIISGHDYNCPASCPDLLLLPKLPIFCIYSRGVLPAGSCKPQVFDFIGKTLMLHLSNLSSCW